MVNENLISIIIPTYKRSHLIKKAIDSVLNQTYKNIEIIVVDDNNYDCIERVKTQKIMEQYEGEKKIKYILHEKNKGGCAARNTGIRESSGDYIAFLDDDDIWSVNFLEKMSKLFTHNNIGAVYCSYYIGTRDRIFYHNRREVLHSGNIRNELLSGWCPASTSFFLIKKECFIEVGLFDQNLESFQDYDMWLRISKKYKFNFTPERLVIKYEHSSEQVSINPYKRKRGLMVLNQKLNKTLSETEYKQFMNFNKRHECEIIKNLILYNKINQNNINYWSLFFEYLKFKEKNLKDSILLFLVILFNISIYDWFEEVKFILFKNKYTIIFNENII